jgi:hypothetical protein
MAHVYMIPLLTIVIFHRYVKLLVGKIWEGLEMLATYKKVSIPVDIYSNPPASELGKEIKWKIMRKLNRSWGLT